MCVATHLKRHFHQPKSVDTALHRGKDLAVAPCTLPCRLIQNCFWIPTSFQM